MPSNHYPFIARESWLTIIIIFAIVLFIKLFFAGPLFLLSLLVLLIIIYLFRDPHREIPSQPLAVVSPVYGVVSKVGEAKEIRLNVNTIRVRIVMRINDIYSLRSPIEGKVVEQWYEPSFKNQLYQHLDFHVQSDEGDDVITAIDMRSVHGLVLAAEAHGDKTGQPAEHHVLGVDQVPAALHIGGLGGIGFHGNHGSGLFVFADWVWKERSMA